MDLLDIIVFIVSLGLLYFIVLTPAIPNLLKAVIVIVEMFLVSKFYAGRYLIQTEAGMLLIKGRYFIEFIDHFGRKYSTFFKLWADMMLFVSFGALMLPFMYWRPKVQRVGLYIFSMAFLLLIMLIYPLAISFVANQIGTSLPVQEEHKSASFFNTILIFIPLFVLGFGGSTLISIYWAALNVLISIYTIFILGQQVELVSGVTLILPGITIPFVEGFLALAILLVVHEICHGFLARAEGISLNSTGLVLFGSLPVGAFVEPSDKELDRASPMSKGRILVAGSASNITFGFIFGVLYLLFFYYAFANFAHICYVQTVTPNGLVLSESANCSSALLPLMKFSDPYVSFMLSFLGLTSGLNFAIGMMNLIPIPLFDGQHIYKAFIHNKTIIDILSYSTLIAFVLLIIPGFI